MSAIKLHLEMAEIDAVKRYADALHVSPEDVLFCALNRLMLAARDPSVQQDICETKNWRRDNLPLWSDSAASIHAYECKECDEPAPSPYL
jgi:hypothetical protein